MEVYLDNSATTRCFPGTAKLMCDIMTEHYGNPSSLHRKGVEAENYIREEVYLDNSATTRCFPGTAKLMCDIMTEHYGNPSSLHRKGVEAENYIREAKQQIARNLKTEEKEIYFTSGGTESDNLALMGCAHANSRAGKHLITTCIEHPAILNTMKELERQGFRVTYLPVDETGRVRLSDLEAALCEETILVSVMYVKGDLLYFGRNGE